MEHFSLNDDFLNQFYSSLTTELQYELKLFKALKNNDENSLQQYAASFKQLLPVIKFDDYILTLQSIAANKNISLIACDLEENKVADICRLIALEVTYRFGALVKNQIAYCLFFSATIDVASKLLMVTKMIAMRIVTYSSLNAVLINNIEGLLAGIVHGYDCLKEYNVFKDIDGILLSDTFPMIPISSMLFNTGIMIPNEDNTYAYWYHKPNSTFGFQIQPYSDPSSASYQICKTHPKEEYVKYIKHCSMRYVTLKHIEDYLYVVRGHAKGSISFNNWLQETFADEFRVNVLALVRNVTINSTQLDSKGLRFDDGDFCDVDFSHCTLENITITSVARSLFSFCQFKNCSAYENAFKSAIISFCTMSGCNWLRSDDLHIKHCSFTTSKVDNCFACSNEFDEYSANNAVGIIELVQNDVTASFQGLETYSESFDTMSSVVGLMRDVSFDIDVIGDIPQIDMNLVIDSNEKPLGSGATCEVRSATYNGKFAAVKKMRDQDSQAEEEILKMFHLEAKLLHYCHGHHVVNLYGVNNCLQPTSIVMERATCSVHQLLHSNAFVDLKNRIDKRRIVHQCCKAFAWLVSRGILHRDIKPKNILYQDNSIRICDFGLGRKFKCDVTAGETAKGTYPYMAPELWSYQDSYRDTYSQSTDMYSFAITMNEIFCGSKPYDGKDDVRFFTSGMSKQLGGLRPVVYEENEHIKSVIQRSWHTTPGERPTFQELRTLLRRVLN